ncbi:MAG: hypothetical protein J3K34DRAFT_412328 [Monoraphidium minutum]|nr:MAG: hypothetical protein J3K34DRAFT_412328 [Monoraphidium minutum]
MPRALQRGAAFFPRRAPLDCYPGPRRGRRAARGAAPPARAPPGPFAPRVRAHARGAPAACRPPPDRYQASNISRRSPAAPVSGLGLVHSNRLFFAPFSSTVGAAGNRCLPYLGSLYHRPPPSCSRPKIPASRRPLLAPAPPHAPRRGAHRRRPPGAAGRRRWPGTEGFLADGRRV